MADTDHQRAIDLNNLVTALSTLPSRIGSTLAADPQFLNDSALGRLAANNELLSIKATRSNP
jgi:hypothetical protein